MRGTELRLARELEWTRLSLAEETGTFTLTGPNGFADVAPSALPFMNLRSSLWLASPRAATSIASAATSLLTRGISVFDVMRDNRLRQRHSIRGYFRARGVKIAWRVRF